uniref:Cadherin N-terminal domain-containing protein n=1 Tax=Poecilia reticulata TaxID=8081 RepID=A0A3P9NKC7_POERE
MFFQSNANILVFVFSLTSFIHYFHVSQHQVFILLVFVEYVCFILFVLLIVGKISYSIPEEMAKGSLIGNIAHDLGLQIKRLTSGKARIFTRDSDEYITDINDNAPSFEKREKKFKISESAAIGAKFVLERAVDLDV